LPEISTRAAIDVRRHVKPSTALGHFHHLNASFSLIASL
jgi:hypothetical protein